LSSFGAYVLRQLALGTVLVAACLTAVVWLAHSLRFVDMIVNRGLPMTTLFELTVLMIPTLMIYVLPIAMFSVVMFTYGRLIGDRELVVMSAAGRSWRELAQPALVLAAVVVLIDYALSIYVMPKANQRFGELQWELRYDADAILIREGEFTEVADAITAYVRERRPNGSLTGLLVHDERDPAKPVTLMAERGALVKTGDGARVVMLKGSRQEWDRNREAYSILYFDAYAFDLDTARERPAVRYRKAFERTPDELWDPAADPVVLERDYNIFRAEFHKRLVTPWYALVFTLAGLAWLFTGEIGRQARNKRILGAVGTFLALQLSFLGLENLTANHPSLAPLMYASVIVFGAMAYAVMAHGPVWRRLSHVLGPNVLRLPRSRP